MPVSRLTVSANGTLKPGVYVVIAKPTQKSKEEYNAEATQWFIVSDLGLTAFSGDDGVHAFVRSLADATPTSGIKVKLIARNNEVLGTAQSDASGYAKFDSALARGEGGLRPALLVAESTGGEYAFLDLTSNAFDLTDRGVKGREAPGPLSASAARANASSQRPSRTSALIGPASPTLSHPRSPTLREISSMRSLVSTASA